MKNGFLRRLLLFMLIAVLLNALLIGAAFLFTSRAMFAKIKTEELTPKAEYIANISGQFFDGLIPVNVFRQLLVNDRTIWESTIHIYTADGQLAVRSEGSESEEALQMLERYVPQVLDGKSVSEISNTDGLGIVVGVPIFGVDAQINGAVFLTKSLQEVHTALNGFTWALLISLVAVFILMIPIAYFGSRNLSRPLNQMTHVARAMAEGDFTIKADENGHDEVGELGHSLNQLSAALSQTIGDLMLERNRLQSILDGVGEGIIAVDANGMIMHSNPVAAKLLGGQPGGTLADLDAFREVWTAIGVVNDTGDTSVRSLKIGEAVIKVTITSLSAADGSRAGTITLLQDVTESERLEQTRRDYVANVSHELRTPIASIRSLADALNDGLIQNEEDKSRYYGYILRESMRLSRLINDLLELSRLQSGTVAMQKQPFEIKELLLDLNEQFSQTAADSGLEFRMHCADGLSKAYANRDRVEQVLVILLDNAVKYAADGGTISLEAESREDGKFLITVRNTGSISPEDLPHLFERFYKADKAHAQTGMGLGLSIAKEIMTLMEEQIWAESVNDEAVFHFTLSPFTESSLA